MPWWWILVGLVLGAAEPSPAPACAGCHPGVVAGHGASRHAVAWSNPIFQAEYRASPKPWCVSCHAPAVAQEARAAPPAAIAARGVDCAACHLAPGGRMRARFRRPGSIHRTLVDRDLGAPADCGRCHQFNFPVLDRSGRRIGDTGEPMQNTVAEVAEHLGERAGCLGCHGEDGAGHRFPGSHDPEMLERALEIELCRDAGALALALENRGAAHRVPSGGVHRFIVARLWKSSAPERLVELRLGRRFAAAGAGAGKRTVADTTLAPGERRRLVARATDLGGAAGEPVNAEVTYVYTLREDALLPGGARNRTPIARLRSPPAKLPRCGE